MKSSSAKKILILLICNLVCLPCITSAAVVALDGAGTTNTDPLDGIPEFTTDILITIPALPGSAPTGTRFVIFESGGDGTGVALWLDVDAEELVFYQDRGSGMMSTPANDTTFSLGISSLAGSEVVIRIQADYSGTDTAEVIVTNGTTTLTSGVQALNGNEADGVGGGNTGLGVIAGAIAGTDENGFTYTNYPSTAPLQANIYDTNSTTYPPPISIPSPSDFVLVPEPSTFILLLLGILFPSFIRKR